MFFYTLWNLENQGFRNIYKLQIQLLRSFWIYLEGMLRFSWFLWL